MLFNNYFKKCEFSPFLSGLAISLLCFQIPILLRPRDRIFSFAFGILFFICVASISIYYIIKNRIYIFNKIELLASSFLSFIFLLSPIAPYSDVGSNNQLYYTIANFIPNSISYMTLSPLVSEHFRAYIYYNQSYTFFNSFIYLVSSIVNSPTIYNSYAIFGYFFVGMLFIHFIKLSRNYIHLGLIIVYILSIKYFYYVQFLPSNIYKMFIGALTLYYLFITIKKVIENKDIKIDYDFDPNLLIVFIFAVTVSNTGQILTPIFVGICICILLMKNKQSKILQWMFLISVFISLSFVIPNVFIKLVICTIIYAVFLLKTKHQLYVISFIVFFLVIFNFLHFNLDVFNVLSNLKFYVFFPLQIIFLIIFIYNIVQIAFQKEYYALFYLIFFLTVFFSLEPIMSSTYSRLLLIFANPISMFLYLPKYDISHLLNKKFIYLSTSVILMISIFIAIQLPYFNLYKNESSSLMERLEVLPEKSLGFSNVFDTSLYRPDFVYDLKRSNARVKSENNPYFPFYSFSENQDDILYTLAKYDFIYLKSEFNFFSGKNQSDIMKYIIEKEIKYYECEGNILILKDDNN